MTLKQFLGLLGFLFVAVWIGFGFGNAILCLLGAGLFAGAGAIVQGDIDLAELQDRLQGGPAQPRSPGGVPRP